MMFVVRVWQAWTLLFAVGVQGLSTTSPSWKSALRYPSITGGASTSSSTRLGASDESETPNNAPRHDVGPASKMELSEAEQSKMESYSHHQQNAPKLGWPKDVRTLVQYNHGFAVLSTFSKADPDYPGGSVVAFAVDPAGRPVFSFSGMSAHTPDILNNPHCSLTVAAKDFKSVADGRVNLMGRTELIQDPEEKKAARDLYLKKHPGAFWVDFGDFNWFRMTVDKVRFVGGFARVGQVNAKEYTEAQPDPVAEFGPAIAQHMNDDHMEATIAMVQANIPGLEPDPDNKITEAIITSVDSLGMYVKVTREKPVQYLPQQFKLRLPFPRPALDRKDVKVQIMELTNAAAVKAD